MELNTKLRALATDTLSSAREGWGSWARQGALLTVALTLAYYASVFFYRRMYPGVSFRILLIESLVYLSPLAKIPGPKLAGWLTLKLP